MDRLLYDQSLLEDENNIIRWLFLDYITINMNWI